MTQELIAVGPTTSLAALLQLFLHHEITGAPVIDERGRPLGIVTSADLVNPPRRSEQAGAPAYYRLWGGDIRAIGITDEGETPLRGVVADVMSSELVGIDRHATVTEAASLMARSDVHRLLVTDGGRACGMVTAMDCLKGLTMGQPGDRAAR